jgi:hypothetical protein
MKQYLLSVHSVAGAEPPPPGAIKQMYQDTAAFNAEIQAEGSWVFGGGLHPASTATVVRAEGGEVMMTDGPFAEGKEHIGGFWVIKAPDLDAALALAARASGACANPVEVRPFQEDAED